MNLSNILNGRMVVISLYLLALFTTLPALAEDGKLSPEEQQKQYIEKLTEAMDLKNYEAAASWCDKIELLGQEKDSKLQFMMGKAYYKTERFKDAQPYLKKTYDIYCTRYGRLSNKTLEVSSILDRCNNKLRPKNTIVSLPNTAKRFSNNPLTTRSNKTPKYMVEKLNEALEGKIEYSEVRPYVDELLPLVLTNDATYKAVTDFLIASKDYEAAQGVLISKLKAEVGKSYKYHPKVLEILEKLEKTFPKTTMDNASLKQEIGKWKNLIKDNYTDVARKTEENKLIELLVNAELAIEKENTIKALTYCSQLDKIEIKEPENLLKIGNLYLRLGYDNKIEEYYCKYLNAIDSDVPPVPENEYVNMLNFLNNLFDIKKEYQKAEIISAKQAAYYEKVKGPQDRFTLLAQKQVEKYRNLAAAKSKEQANGEETEDEPTAGSADPQEIKARFTVLRQYIKSGNKAEADKAATKLEPLIEGDPHNLYMLGLGYYSNKNNDKAAEILAKAVAEYNKQYEYDNYKTSQALKKLIDLYIDKEQFTEAAQHSRQLLAIYKNKWGSDHKNTVKARKELEELEGKISDSKIALVRKEEQPSRLGQQDRDPMSIIKSQTMMGGITSAEDAAKNFVLAGFQDDLEYYIALCLPNPYMYILNLESSEAIDPSLAKLTKNDLKAVECKPGETTVFPDGTKFTFNYGDGWDGRKMYLVYFSFAPNPLPVWVHKIDSNRWAADANPYIQLAKKVLEQNSER